MDINENSQSFLQDTGPPLPKNLSGSPFDKNPEEDTLKIEPKKDLKNMDVDGE